MTTTLPYQSAPAANPSTCPLCRKRPVKPKKRLYGHLVCKKCFYAFVNRRQFAYIIDALIVLVPNVLIVWMVQFFGYRMGLNTLEVDVAMFLVGIPLFCFFASKDGFNGGSPGKKLLGVQVLDESSNQPIGFAQSFKRNSVLITGVIPFVGRLVNFVILIIIVVKMGKGHRIGDRYARTRVIWKKFAHLPVFGGDALVCETCGYDLSGNQSGVCPECGTTISARNAALLASGPIDRTANALFSA